DKSSVILKYYPPFLAADKTIPISQERYLVEKEALQFLSSRSWLKKCPNSIVRIPKAIYADDKNFVLLMEDAGENTKTLFNLLLSNSSPDQNLLDLIPNELNKFLSYLNNESGLTPTTNKIFQNKSAWDLIEEYINELNFTADRLDKRIKPYLERSHEIFKRKDDENAVFVFGDLWPNSILIDQEKKLIWIVDWEVARYETKTRDFEQLLANLWVMKQSPKFDQNKIEKLIRKFQLEFFGNEDSDWRLHCGDFGKCNFILWVTGLLNETHWGIDDNQAVALKALNEIHT
ncbi:unnamed protein product, partial [Brachionus calyciflorus]